jgi:hypothetical protein
MMADGGVPFPGPYAITARAIAFARMMFAHAAFEREVSALQDVVTDKLGFGEQRRNQWGARERPERMVKLIEYCRGDFSETAEIKGLLTDAIDPCEQRNLLAHGTWWCFYPHTSTILVRSGTRWGDADAPEHREYTADNIETLVDKFGAIEDRLYRLRRSLEQKWSKDE